MVNLIEDAASAVMVLIFAGVMAGAGLIALSSFASGQTGAALAGINNATAGITNFTLQLPTIGTILAVGLIITVLVAALLGAYGVFMRK